MVLCEPTHMEASSLPLAYGIDQKVVTQMEVTMSTTQTQYCSRLGLTLGALALGGIACSTPSLAAEGRAAATLCYLWADQQSTPLNTPYQPDPTWSFNAVNGPDGNS